MSMIRIKWAGALALLLAVAAGAPQTAPGVSQTIADSNTTAAIETDSALGLWSWQVDGIEQLNRQATYFRLGSDGPETNVATLTQTAVSTSPSALEVGYAGPGFAIDTFYMVSGWIPGSGRASLTEDVEVTNTSGGPLALTLFRYFDPDADHAAGYNTLFASANVALQHSPRGQSFRTELFPPADRFEAVLYQNLVDTLEDLDPTTLARLNGEVSGPLEGDSTAGFQWNLQLAAGQSVLLQLRHELVPAGAPAAVHDRAAVNANSPQRNFTVLRNDFYAGPPQVTIIGPPALGEAQVNPNGTIRYTPYPNAHGADSILYAITVGGETSNFAEVATTVTPPVAPNILVLGVTGATNWPLDTLQTIRWSSYGVAGNVRVRLSTNGGATYSTILNDIPNSGEAQWRVAGSPSNNVRVRVEAMDLLTRGDTPTFRILPAPTITLTDPTAASVWAVNTLHSIQWTSVNTDHVRVLVSRDGGATWTSLFENLHDAGHVTWLVTGPASAQARIRVETMDQAAYGDSASFTIIQP